MDSEYRRITSGASSASSGRTSVVARQEGKGQTETETVCYHPNAKIVSVVAFNDISSPTGSEIGPKSGGDSLAWNSQLEQTIAVGPLQIYRAPASIAFLSCGAALQALFPKSQCWCLDSSGSKYILQIRPPHYWRIELPVAQVEERQMAAAFQKSIKDILLFEKSQCPLRQDDNSRTAAGQVTENFDNVPTTSIRSYPSTPNLAIKSAPVDVHHDNALVCSDSPEKTDQTDTCVEKDSASNGHLERTQINLAFRDEIRLMKSFPALPTNPTSTDGANQANMSKKRRSSSASPAKCLASLSVSQNKSSDHNTKPSNRTPTSLLSRAVQGPHSLVAQPLAEVSNHTATALFRHPDAVALGRRNAPDSKLLDGQASGTCESRSTALDGQLRETRARRLQRPEIKHDRSVPDRSCFPVSTVDPVETKGNTGRLQILDSIYEAFTKLPGQLWSLIMRLAKTVADVLWAAEPAAYAEFSQGNYVPEWDDSGGELSGFSEDDEYIVGEHLRRLRKKRNL